VADAPTQRLKIELLKQQGTPELALYLRYAKDPSFAYHMTKRNIPAAAAHSESHFPADFKGLIALLNSMHDQRWNKPDTKLFVADWLKRASESYRLLFQMAIDRKLPGNLGRTLINKVWPELIYKQPYGGCKPWDPNMVHKRFTWGTDNHLQHKEDGMTLMIDISNLSVHTRQGQDVTKQMRRYVQPIFDTLSGYENVLHVEAMMFEPDCHLRMKRPKANGLYNKIFKHEGSVASGRMLFVILDCIDSYHFYNGCDPTDQAERYVNLTHLAQLYQTKTRDFWTTVPKMEAVQQTAVKSLEDARAITQNIIKMGGEGAILKDPRGAWRSTKMASQMKIKHEFECTMLVVGYKPHKVNPEWVGSLNVASSCGNISTFVGSGLNEEDGSDLDRRQGFEAFDGKLVEVKAESVSKHNALNLPRIVEIRTDKEWADDSRHIIAEANPGI
jgi:hypothetical protein